MGQYTYTLTIITGNAAAIDHCMMFMKPRTADGSSPGASCDSSVYANTSGENTHVLD